MRDATSINRTPMSSQALTGHFDIILGNLRNTPGPTLKSESCTETACLTEGAEHQHITGRSMQALHAAGFRAGLHVTGDAALQTATQGSQEDLVPADKGDFIMRATMVIASSSVCTGCGHITRRLKPALHQGGCCLGHTCTLHCRLLTGSMRGYLRSLLRLQVNASLPCVLARNLVSRQIAPARSRCAARCSRCPGGPARPSRGGRWR